MIYCDLLIDGVGIWYGIPCLNLVPIGSLSYLNFIGYLFFNDSKGSSDPDYTGFGDVDRFQLLFSLDGIDWDQLPLKAIPSQQFDIDLGSQSCTVSVYQK